MPALRIGMMVAYARRVKSQWRPAGKNLQTCDELARQQ